MRIMKTIVAIAASLLLTLASCAAPADTPSPTLSPSPTTTGAPTDGATASPSPATASPTPTETPAPTEDETADLPPFECDALPVEGDGDVDLANIADVRVGEHEGYDRVVFEFQGYLGPDDDEGEAGVPQYRLRAAEPPLRDTPRGAEMDVAGSAFAHLTLIGGTRLTGDFEETYTGPLEFAVDGAAIAEVVEAGDFEATADWYVGLEADQPCLRVFDLEEPPRLVIDIEHP